MYGLQFQSSAYPEHNVHYDVSNTVAGDSKNVFPSPLTSTLLDSPPNHNSKPNHYMHSSNSPTTKSFDDRIHNPSSYSMTPYLPTSSHFNHHTMLSLTTDNNLLMRSPTSPNQPHYQNNQSTKIPEHMSDSLMSPISPDSFEEEIIQRNMQEIFEKKRRRRESHNAVERRRRDNINDRINELATLLPDRDAPKLNKGTILRKSVDHIRLLNDKLRQHQQRIQELENKVYRINHAIDPPGHPLDLSEMQPQFSHATYQREG